MATSALVHDAAVHEPASSARGLLEKSFARVFGQGLVYPQIWEDPEIDLEALQLDPGARIVAIASGGCNILSYLMADPARITAVDLNPAHLALLRLKLGAIATLPDHATFARFFGGADDPANIDTYLRHIAPSLDGPTRGYWESRDRTGRKRIGVFGRGFYRTGLLGRAIGMGHLACKLAGVDPRRLTDFTTDAERRHWFETEMAPVFDRPWVRAMFAMPVSYFGLGIPPAQYDAMRDDADGNLADLVRERLRRLALGTPFAENYFAWQAFARGYDRTEDGAVPPYLAAANWPLLRERAARIEPVHQSVTDRLLAETPGSIDAIVLLDAQDWMDRAQTTALWTAVRQATSPGARVIFRTAAAAHRLDALLPEDVRSHWRYEAERSAELHARDRSAIYGGFHLFVRHA